MEVIKTFQREGSCLSPQFVKAIAKCKAHLAVFNSPLKKTINPVNNRELDRENVLKNYLTAGSYRNGKPYSIIIDDDVILTPRALRRMLEGIKTADAVTIPVEGKARPSQHACLIIRNDVIDEYPIRLWNTNFCNQCIWIARLIDIQKKNIMVLKKPILKTIKREHLQRKEDE